MAAESTANNAWVDSYLDALLTYGLSTEYLKSTRESEAKRKAPDADRSLYSRYYVQSLLNLDEQALHSAWSKASSATRQGGEKDARLVYLSWRIWHMRRRHAEVQRALKAHAEEEGEVAASGPSYSSDEEGDYDEYSSYFKPYGRLKGPEREAGRERGKQRDGSPASPSGGKARAAALSPQRGGGGDLSPPPRGAARAAGAEPVEQVKPRELQVKLGGVEALETVFEELAGTPTETPRAGGAPWSTALTACTDTGGQVKYVVELAKALSLHPSVYRVDLLTRLIQDPSVDASYGQAEECIAKGRGELGGAYIVRLPCGPPEQYVGKERLWPYVREFADRGIAHATSTLAAMAEAGRRCELYAVHGHYADAGEVAVLMSCTLDVQMVMTGHSLGRNKLEHLLASGTMTRREIEDLYAIGRRIEAEERCLDNALMVFTSTRQEIEEQWGLYDGYSPQLSRVLRFHRTYGRHMPVMKVIPPGLDFSNLKVSMPEDPTLREFEQARAVQDLLERPQPLSPASGAAAAATSPHRVSLASGPGEASGGGPGGAGGGGAPATAPPTPSIVSGGQASPRGGSGSASEMPSTPTAARAGVGPAELVLDPNKGPPIWREITRFLHNPLKPAILAMSRPDHKKNITTLVEAFGKHSMLRELANLVLIMGNRDAIDSMASGSQKVLTQVLKLIDAHDLYGSVSYPKHHTQMDISDIYLFAYATRGVFVNPALQEPFGLTVIEAAAHGVPTIATKNGGPVDIMATLHHGEVVDPTDSDAIAAALLRILTHPGTWDEMSTNGVKNIMAYSWPSHCKRYLEAIEVEKRAMRSAKKHDRTLSGLLGRRPAGMTGLTESTKEQHDAKASHGAMHGADTLSRYFSSPQPMALSKEGDIMSAAVHHDLGKPPPRKTASGVSSDDLAILASLDTEALLRGGELPKGEQRHALVAVAVDSDFALPQAVAAVQGLLSALTDAGLRNDVGVGMLSMLGFDSTCDAMKAAGINRGEFDFMVCNSGADVWHQYADGRWDADEAYEGQIGFEWDRVVLHRMLTKIISAPQENNRRLPRLKELLYNVAEHATAGVHPRHICLELDAESQAILSAGMGPRGREAQPSPARSLALVERLRRRLRSKGMRASYNLQMVPRSPTDTGDFLSVLHITPLRASRPLALRYLAQRLGMPLDRLVVLAVAPEAAGPAADLIAGCYCSDVPDLVAGMQPVCLALPPESERGGRGGKLINALGVTLQPYLTGSSSARVALAALDTAAAAVHILASVAQVARRALFQLQQTRWASSAASGDSRPWAIVFLGPPGVGKGTYSTRVADYFGLNHIASGDLVRDEMRKGSEIGKEMEACVNAGNLLPDALILRVIREHFMRAHSEGSDKFLLDGFPRTGEQAAALEQIADVQLAVNLGLREEVLVEKCMGRRLCKKCGKNYNVADIHLAADPAKGLPEIVMPPLSPPPECAQHMEQRADDTEPVIRRRLEIYTASARPVEDFYARSGKLLDFEITGGIPQTLPRLLDVLKPQLEPAAPTA
ncbi:Sucrose-phosphate synthase [Micractinium conductrix]|uniref:Sucrose-phosphate synthase n=1 Tax=Micractinium conductrix TaxID=554055 RepID=A0A2P6V677_9CHLO|nr:Sucrose-phosphate synthase [Micractinium conductrix]|eukprot:PSC69593.1 Sucrose-phosphate synthase [Micractinium conductrix]